MFKKFMAIMLAMVLVAGCAITANAACLTENDRPTIIGMEMADHVAELDRRYREDDTDLDAQPYEVTIKHVDDVWMACLEGEDDFEGYMAIGFYDHLLNEDELNVLWANRMTADELYDLLEELGL